MIPKRSNDEIIGHHHPSRHPFFFLPSQKMKKFKTIIEHLRGITNIKQKRRRRALFDALVDVLLFPLKICFVLLCFSSRLTGVFSLNPFLSCLEFCVFIYRKGPLSVRRWQLNQKSLQILLTRPLVLTGVESRREERGG